MSLQLSDTVRAARLDTIETTIGAAPHFHIRTSTPPTNCAAADAGSLILDLTLPSDWMNAASGSSPTSKTKAGTWSGAATAGGTAGHFRVKDPTNATCHMQGTCGQGSGDLSFDNSVIANGQTVTINTFTLNEQNG